MTLQLNNIRIAWPFCLFVLAFGACDPVDDAEEDDTNVVTDLSQGDITLECQDVASTEIFTKTATFDLMNVCQHWPDELQLSISVRNTEQNDALDLTIMGFDGPGEYVADPGGTADTVTSLYYYADAPGETGSCDAHSLADPACATQDQLTNPYCTIEVLDTNLIGLELGVDGWVSFAVTCEKLFQACTNIGGQETTVVDPQDHRVEYVIADCTNQ